MHLAIRNAYTLSNKPATHIALHASPTILNIITATDAEEDQGVAGASVHEGFAGLWVRTPSTLEVRIDDLWRRKEWKDASIWAVNYGDGAEMCMYNFTAESFPMRRTFLTTSRLFQLNSCISLFVPYTEATFSDISFCVLLSGSNERLVTNMAFTEGTFEDMGGRVERFLPTLTLSGPDVLAPNAIGTYTIRAFLHGQACDHPLDVELEYVNGYLPATRVRVAGEATFDVRALDMRPGCKLKLKAGFRYLRSVAEKVIEVVHG